MPGMFGNLGVFLHTAKEARNRAIAFVEKNPEGSPTDAIVTIVLSALCCEAFINELVEETSLSTIHNRITPELQSFLDTQQEIESEHGSLKLKYLMASNALSGNTFDRGTSPFQDFATLVSVRNDLVHHKPSRDKFVLTDTGEEMRPPKYLAGLQGKGIAPKSDKGVKRSWISLISTAEMASWAYASAREIMIAILKMIPDHRVPMVGAGWHFKQMLIEQDDYA